MKHLPRLFWVTSTDVNNRLHCAIANISNISIQVRAWNIHKFSQIRNSTTICLEVFIFLDYLCYKKSDEPSCLQCHRLFTPDNIVRSHSIMLCIIGHFIFFYLGPKNTSQLNFKYDNNKISHNTNCKKVIDKEKKSLDTVILLANYDLVNIRQKNTDCQKVRKKPVFSINSYVSCVLVLVDKKL